MTEASTDQLLRSDDIGTQQLLVRRSLKITQPRQRRATKITCIVDHQIRLPAVGDGSHQLLAMVRLADIARNGAHGGQLGQGLAVLASGSACRASMVRLQPRRASSKASARPNPSEAPVISA